MRFQSTDEFHDWFLSTVTMHCNTLDEAEAVIDDSILDDWIIPLTDWSPEAIHKANKKTVIFWYLLRLMYLYSEGYDPIIDYYYDDIFLFLDSQNLN